MKRAGKKKSKGVAEGATQQQQPDEAKKKKRKKNRADKSKSDEGGADAGAHANAGVDAGAGADAGAANEQLGAESANDDDGGAADASDGEDAAHGEEGADAAQAGAADGKPRKRSRPNGSSGKKRRTTAEEVVYLRQKVKDLQTRLGKQKDDEKRKKEEAKQAKSEAKANRKRNNFIVVRECARATRCPFSYNRRDRAGVRLYVWQQRPMKNGNLFWCPVAITENDTDALATANLTREQAAAVIRGEPVEGIISGEKERCDGDDGDDDGSAAEE